MNYWMQINISRSKKSGVRGSNLVLFWSDQAMLCRNGLFQLPECRHTVTNGWGPSFTPNDLFLERNSTRQVLLRDIWQRTSYYNLMFWRMEIRARRHQPTNKSAHWLQGVKVLYDYQEINPAASKMGRIPIKVQLYNQLPEWQKKTTKLTCSPEN